MVVAERQLEALKLEGMGLSQPEIVKQISQKFQVSARSVYRDFQLRSSWQPVLLQLKDSDEYDVQIAENLEEAKKLLEVGFEYVTDMDGLRLFRRVK